jgi:hypothetical protein
MQNNRVDGRILDAQNVPHRSAPVRRCNAKSSVPEHFDEHGEDILVIIDHITRMCSVMVFCFASKLNASQQLVLRNGMAGQSVSRPLSIARSCRALLNAARGMLISS